MRNATMIGIRLKKFNIGKINSKTGICEDAWLDFYEDEDLTKNTESHSKFFLFLFHYYLKFFSIFVDGISSKIKYKKVGRFCGTLYDLFSNYYTKSTIFLINFYVATTNTNLSQTKKEANDYDQLVTHYYNYEFEFEIMFPETSYIKNLATEYSFSYKKHFHTDLNSDNKHVMSGKTFYDGLYIHESQCNRLYKDCFKNNDNKSYACIINSPQYPGIYSKNLKCLLYLRKSSANETFIIINSYMQIDSKICLNKNLKKNQYKSYICENTLRIGEACKDHISIYNGSSTSNNLLAEKICGNGYLPKITTKLDSFVFSFISNTDGLFANLGFIFYILNEKQYFSNYQYFNDKIFSSDISNVEELKSIQKIEKLQVKFCDSFSSKCAINLSLDEDVSGYLFSFSQYHFRNFTLKYTLTTKKFNTIGIFIENYFIFKCAENYLSIEVNNIEVEKICYENYPEYALNKKLYLIDNQVSNKLVITHFKLNQVFDSQKLYDFKIFYEYLNLSWDLHVKNSICNYVIKPNKLTDHIINPLFDIIYKFDSLNCKYQLIGNKNQYIKLTFNEISFNNDNCNENLFVNGKGGYDVEQRCSKIDVSLMIKEPDLHFTSMIKHDGSHNKTILKACVCKRIHNRKVFISQTNFIELSYNLKIKQLRGWNHRQNKFNITYEFITRNCNSLKMTELKGVIEYDTEQKYGIQQEFLNQTNFLLNDYNSLNKNYNCRFNINAPEHSLVYVEFLSLEIPSSDCDFNFIKLYSKHKTAALKLCNMTSALFKKQQILNTKNVLINAEFSNENISDKTLSCYYRAKKLCFISSDLNQNSKAIDELDDSLNKISIEVFASMLIDFKFKIRFHFFTLDNHTYSNYNKCDLKCNSKISLPNDTQPSNVCIKKEWLCDDSVDCIYSEEDEYQCKIFMLFAIHS